MFEVGKRYKKKNIEGVYVFDCPQNGYEYGWFKGEATGKLILLMYSSFDPTPIDDAPAPRMVTTCDIGARVVRGRDWNWRSQDGGAGNKGTIVEAQEPVAGWCAVSWDKGAAFRYRVGIDDKFDLYYADEQPKKKAEIMKEATPNPVPCCPVCGINLATGKEVMKCGCGFVRGESSKDNDGTDKAPPDPASGIASVMFGSKPRLMYGSLMQIQGPTKDEEQCAKRAKNAEERKRYDKR